MGFKCARKKSLTSINAFGRVRNFKGTAVVSSKEVGGRYRRSEGRRNLLLFNATEAEKNRSSQLSIDKIALASTVPYKIFLDYCV